MGLRGGLHGSMWVYAEVYVGLRRGLFNANDFIGCGGGH